MMEIIRVLKSIAEHPLNRGRKIGSIVDFLKWQLGSRLVSGPMVYEWVNGAKFVVRNGDAGLTGNMYMGLHEFEDMAYLMHVLRKQDLFVDVGANLGSYTLLACSSIGARGYVFEPVPDTFEKLMLNIRINELGGRVNCLNCGVGEKNGTLLFTKGLDTVNHVVAPGESVQDSVEVPVCTLDSVLSKESPNVVKIDVEGLETSVLRGASKLLENESVHSVIMELNGCGRRYGFDDESIVELMSSFGFLTYSYDPFRRKLEGLGGKCNEEGNTLFVRDLGRVERLLLDSPRFNVGDCNL